MGFLDKAKKLAEQAKGLAEQAKEMAEGALDEAKSRIPSGGDGGGGRGGGSAGPGQDPRMGTAYVPGMLGRAGWRERGLTDPAAVLPIDERDRVGIPHSTRSVIVAEPWGVGRRWASGGRSAGLFYQLDPDQQSWQPPMGQAPYAPVDGAWAATHVDGQTLVFLPANPRVVVELNGLDEQASMALVRAAAAQVGA